MARTISITSRTENTDAILQKLASVEHLLELQVYRGASLSPPGDVIKLAVPNADINDVMRILDKFGLGKKSGVSMSTSDPAGIIPSHSSYEVERDNNEASWEEMAMTISDDSNTTMNTLLIMFISGSLAAIGIATNALHIVIGGMLIAPGFMPITRIALGLIARHRTWRYGLLDFIQGYLALIAGALMTAVVLKAVGYDPLPGAASYYATEKKLAYYWTTISTASGLASFVAGIAGGLLVASKRSVLASGVMIGLALVPSAALIGIGILEAEMILAKKALFRFALDVALVLTASLAVLLSARLYLHKRDMQL